MFTDLAGNELTGAAILIPVITGIVQALKMVGLRDKFAPLAALGIGAGLAVLLRAETQSFTSAVFSGLIFGLSSSGLYSGLVHTLGLAREARTVNSPYDTMNIPQQNQQQGQQQPQMQTMNYQTETARPTAIIVDNGASVTKAGDTMSIETDKKE